MFRCIYSMSLFKRIFKTLILSLPITSTFILSGCRNESQEPSVAYDPQVAFTINLSSPSQGTKADGVDDPYTGEEWGEGKHPESGTAFDHTINSVSAVLYPVKDDNTLDTSRPAGELEKPEYTYLENGNLKISGVLKTSLDMESLEKGTFRLAVFINTPEVNPQHPEEITFTRHGIPGIGLMTGIPMYGVGKADFTGLSKADATEGNPFEIKKNPSGEKLQIPVLRAMAKIRVKVKQELFTKRGMKLHKLTMSRHAPEGFVVPGQWDSKETVALLEIGESMNAFRPETEAGYQHSCSVLPSVEKNTYDLNSWTMLRFYIPETYNYFNDNIMDSEELCLTVEYFTDENEPEPKKHNIYFRPYTPDGHPDRSEGVRAWDLVRNHIYEYMITGIEPRSGELLVTVDADWWGEHKLDLE